MKKIDHLFNVISIWLHLIIPIAVIIGLVGVRLMDFDGVKQIRLSSFDSYQKLQPRPFEKLPIKIIDIDDASLARLGQWPWPRLQVAELVKQLKERGAVAIGFDVVFPEPDKTSPQNILKIWEKNAQISQELQNKIKKLRSHDAIFAEAIAQADNVVLGFPFDSEANHQYPKRIAQLITAEPNAPLALQPVAGAVKNLDLLENVAKGNGSYDIYSEVDSVVRRLPLLFRMGDAFYPSLVLELLRVQQNTTDITIHTRQQQNQPQIVSVQVGKYTIPTDESGNIWIHFSNSEQERSIPVWKILDKNQQVDLKNTIVLIGASASGLKDQRVTPLTSFASSDEIHSNALEQIVTQQFLSVPQWTLQFDIAVIILWGIFFIRYMPQLGPVFSLLICSVFISILLGTGYFIFLRYDVLIDPSYSSISLLIIYFIVSIINYLKTESERNNVRKAFNRYLSPSLTEQLVKNPDKLELGGETREMTILFCDIRGFTTISEQFDAHGLTQFINEFLTPMTKVILENSGTIDKYIGDCIMAFWNAPLDDPDHANHAATSALLMMNELIDLNYRQKSIAKKEHRRFIPIAVGVGLNTGLCCVGNMGSEMRFDYSVIGDDVNLASRLEGQSKNYGVSIVIGESTYEKIKHDFAIIELDLIQVKGKLKAVRIYSLLGDKQMRESDEFMELEESHQDMLMHYRLENWQEALHLVKHCQKIDCFNLTVFYQLYERRIYSFMHNPPKADWNGIYIATSK
jgi:adenylate cyclase